MFAVDVGADLLERRIGGQARARVRRDLRRVQVADIDQVLGMRHHDVVSVAAGAVHAQAGRRGAVVFHARYAGRALAAADPRIDEVIAVAGQARGVGACCDDGAHGFMAHRQRQRHAAVFQGQRAALAQVITAFPQVDIA
ncbi:hypothetical protein G6F35_017210 [Rhizopus arrhizus]|nr:hypothetical protein G6F35_017210 [Rhizopus arrhizus]